MDKIALLFSFLGIFLNSRKIIWCWPVWILGNGFWIIYDLQENQITSVILWAGFIIFNIYGWYQWKKDKEK